MRALELTGPGQDHLVELPDPTPGPDEIVIDVQSWGICGTDLRIVQGTTGTSRSLWSFLR